MAHHKSLVSSAQAADFCSHSGRAITLCTARQDKGHVIDLTYGERGQSEDFWKGQGSKSTEGIKKLCRAEAEEAATVLGVSIEFMDYGNYPLFLNRKQLDVLPAGSKRHLIFHRKFFSRNPLSLTISLS